MGINIADVVEQLGRCASHIPHTELADIAVEIASASGITDGKRAIVVTIAGAIVIAPNQRDVTGGIHGVAHRLAVEVHRDVGSVVNTGKVTPFLGGEVRRESSGVSRTLVRSTPIGRAGLTTRKLQLVRITADIAETQQEVLLAAHQRGDVRIVVLELIDIDLALHGELGQVAESLIVAETRHKEGLAVDVCHIGSDDRHEDDIGHRSRVKQVAVGMDADRQAVVLALLKLRGVGNHQFGRRGDIASGLDSHLAIFDAVGRGRRRHIAGIVLGIVGIEQVGGSLKGRSDGLIHLGGAGNSEGHAVVAFEALSYGGALHRTRDIHHVAVVRIAVVTACHDKGKQGEKDIF